MNSNKLQKIKGLFVQSLFALIVAAPGVATANTINQKTTNYSIPSDAYFVAPNGKDTNSGRSADSPWTVTKALLNAPAGATIVFRGGEYRNINAPIRRKLTLQAYPNEKPLLKGSDVVTGWVSEGGIWRKDGWNYSFPPNVPEQYIDPKFPMAGHRDMVYINGVALKQVSSKAEVDAGKFYVDPANNRMYIGDNPSGKTVEATTQERGLILVETDRFDPTNSVIRGLGFAHYANFGVMVSVPRITLENNTFAWNAQQGAVVYAADALVRGNNFSYNGRQGLFGVSTHNTRVENNVFANNNVESFSDWDAAGVKFIWTDGAVFRGNRAAHNNSTGIWLDESTTNTIVVNNVVHHNRVNGIYFEISHKAIIASNIAYQNYPAGIMVLNASSARIYNNTLADNHANLIIKETPRNNTKSHEIANGITWITRNNIVKNNLLWNSKGSMLFAPGCEEKEPSSLMIPTMNYNGYYRQSSNNINHVRSLGPKQCSVAYRSLSTFSSATGMEANGLDVVNASDPFFVNVDVRDYRLKSGSPAIGRGEALPADIAEAIGVSSGVRVNLGAFESRVDMTP